jgi:hypothetical protein
MKKTLLIATALTASAYTFSWGATQETASLLESLPAEVQKANQASQSALISNQRPSLQRPSTHHC